VREQLSLVLQHNGKAAIEASVTENQDATLSKECLSMLVEYVADTKALTQPHQRQIVYETLYHIGANVTGTGFAATSRGANSNTQPKKRTCENFFRCESYICCAGWNFLCTGKGSKNGPRQS
jgi:hypothetical protein